MTPHTEVWYEIQYSFAGEDDWFASGMESDSLAGARKKIAAIPVRVGIEHRVVKVTRSEETI